MPPVWFYSFALYRQKFSLWWHNKYVLCTSLQVSFSSNQSEQNTPNVQDIHLSFCKIYVKQSVNYKSFCQFFPCTWKGLLWFWTSWNCPNVLFLSFRNRRQKYKEKAVVPDSVLTVHDLLSIIIISACFVGKINCILFRNALNPLS